MATQTLQDAKSLFNETVKALEEHREDEIYERLADIQVELDEDPLVFGPKSLQDKVYQARKGLDIVEQIFLGASKRHFAAAQDFRAKTVAFELSKKYLFATDTDVRAGRSQSDRDALASIKLREEVTELHLAEAILQELEAILLVIKAKRSDIKNTQSSIREQMRLCYARIDGGETWGSAVKGAMKITPGRVIAEDVDVHNLIAQVEGEIQVSLQEEEEDDLEEVKEVEEVLPDPQPPKVLPLLKSSDDILSRLVIQDSDIGDLLEELDAMDNGDIGGPSEDPQEDHQEDPQEDPGSTVILPEASGKPFVFDQEVSADFDRVIDMVEVPRATRSKMVGVQGMVEDSEVDELLELFGEG